MCALGVSWICVMVNFCGVSQACLGCKLDRPNAYFSRCKSVMFGVKYVCVLGASWICLGCKLNICLVVTFLVYGVQVMCALCASWICTMGASLIDGGEPLGSMVTSRSLVWHA